MSQEHHCRNRSYDPTTGTFLGHDGGRHPCQ
ncbi:BA14K family protein [Bradyrhizobium jicamae]|uniref:Lectin-like protein BA14k n=1 Tax=Bradyrhizobium jicamae TaxID=280332 RepID=A0ABS5FV98_9BRAD|nr:BA14K family protein [Bradyrhizobium jicamae]